MILLGTGLGGKKGERLTGVEKTVSRIDQWPEQTKREKGDGQSHRVEWERSARGSTTKEKGVWGG